MASVNAGNPDNVSRRVLLLSGGLALVLLLAIGAFVALRGRTAPLWVTRHSTPPTATR